MLVTDCCAHRMFQAEWSLVVDVNNMCKCERSNSRNNHTKDCLQTVYHAGMYPDVCRRLTGSAARDTVQRSL